MLLHLLIPLLNITIHIEMTYLDLLTELESFDDDLLLQKVSVYDTESKEYAPVGVLLKDNITGTPYLEV